VEDKSLEDLFRLANKLGNRRYHKLTPADFEEYRKFDYWRYIQGDYECGTTQVSRDWVADHSDWYCPICLEKFAQRGGRTIDHKLPRAQYPWLSLDFRNFWVICQICNEEKAEMHWYEYEHYMITHHPQRYASVRDARPLILLKSLKE
jgi:5-methylcytosine-specific restriction endonuclease McrA